MLDAYDAQRCTFGTLLKKLPIPRDPSRLPLVSVLFNVDQAVSGDALSFAGLQVSYRSNPRSFENFEIFINAAETKGQVVLECQFNVDLFSQETIRRWLAAYEELLRGMVADDQRPLAAVPILPAAERTKIVYEWNATFSDFPRQTTLPRLFEEQAAKTPDRVAVVCEDASVTFGELDQRANRVARHLRAIGVKKDVLVGLCVGRSIDMLVGLVGILKAGGAYVPLDPAFPRDRLAFMMEDSKMPVLVTEDALAAELPAHGARIVRLDGEREALANESAAPLDRGDDDAGPEHPAYVIYTSGSTGKPKGVCVPHRAVVNFVTSMAKEPGLTDQDVLLAVTTLSFDIAVLELHLPLSAGAKIVLATREVATDGALLRDRIAQHGVTVMQATPSTWRLLLAAGWKGDEHFKILCGGEALPRELAGELTRRGGSVWNMYGPTETTVWSTCYRVSNPPGRILIGKPIANTTVYVMDERLEPVPVGVPGELHIGGDGVTLGYLNRPELTQERFVASPFDASTKLYKTGDVVRYLPDGNIEYLRRNDNQVKLRGYRIELGEIEAVLSAGPGVKQAVVVLREMRPGDVRLVAYVVADGAPSDADLRAHLRSRLPEYMTPQHFVTLPSFPLTPNGKIDRKALPLPAVEQGAAAGEYVAPRTPTETAIATVFQQVLGVRRVSIDDNFFELGGHSLLAAQAFSRLERDHGIVLPLRKMFESPTIAGLARTVAGPQKMAETAAAPQRIPRRSDAHPPPLSLMQQRIWLLEQFDPGLSVFNLPSAFRIKGKLDVDAFERAVNEIVRRHESPRTTFRWHDGEAVQNVMPELRISLVPPIDLSEHPASDRETELLSLLQADASVPFDVVQGPLVRGKLYRLDAETHVFFWMPHHAVWDGWSFDVFLTELDLVYDKFRRGEPSPLEPLPIRYQDFAEWHRGFMQSDELKEQLDFWRKQLAGNLPSLDLPTDRPRPARLSYKGQTEPFMLAKAEIDALTALGRREGATLYMVLIAAFEALVYRVTGQTDLILGTPIRGRSRPETENLLGFFVNTLVLRTDASNNPSFLELVGRVRKVALDAYGHQDTPFELLVQELGVQRDTSRTPIFQAFFTYQDVSNRAPRLGDLTYSQIHVHAPFTQTDIYMWAKETGQGLTGGIDYSTDLFDRETIARLLKRFHQLLVAVCEDPTQPIDRIPLMPEAELRVMREVNATEAPYQKELGVHQLVERQAQERPDAVAVVFQGESMTYGELDARAGELARRLSALGVGRGILVGLMLERSHAMIVAMLAVLKAGGAYVPLDPAFPPERLAFMVEDARLGVIVSQSSIELPPHQGHVLLVDRLDPADLPPHQPTTPSSGDAPVYVIYTSGSTGKPKGVQIPHSAVVNFLTSITRTPGLSDRDTLLAVTTLSFDIAVLELWLPLSLGAKVILASREDAADGDRLLALVRKSGVTVMQATPATWRLLLASGLAAGDLDKVLVGGEALPPDLAEELVSRARSVWNMYGPTETTVWSTCSALRAPVGRVLIGRPLANTRVYVLDERGEPCPLGVPGELFIGGDGVALGYLNRPELTAERFLPDPFVPGGRMYKTGDLVRLLADGNLEYLRRNDNQVKLRGYRIELGEVEAMLQKHDAVRQAVAVVREDHGDARLVAYVQKEEGRDATDSELRTHLRGFLPDYMVPQLFVELAELPLTPNGKIDRKALPSPLGIDDGRDDHVEPRTDQEVLVADIWKDVLSAKRVSVHDNFFSIGGHSLLSIKVIARIERTTGVRLNPRVLLLNSLAQVAAQLPAGSATEPVPSQRHGAGEPASLRTPLVGFLRKVKQKLRGA
jgi:amino acid adenylation domain-containing protein